MAIKDDGSLWAWGTGILGDGVERDFWFDDAVVTPIKIMDSVASVAALRQRTFAITTDGALYAWGAGILGDGVDRDLERPALTPVRIMDSVVSVTAYETSTTIGTYSTFAIKTDGSLWAWGSGQLGDEVAREMFSENPALTPVKILDSVESVYTDYDRAFAIQTDGSLWAWGSTAYGLLGCGTVGEWNDYRTTPVKILDSAVSVSINSSNTMVICTDNSLWAWGSGALGDGRDRDYLMPLTRPSKIMDDVIQVSAGSSSTMILKTDGSLWAWGYGAVGDSNIRDWESPALTPVKIMDSVANIVDGAYSYSMVITTDGCLWAWGNNLGGQLGDGTASGFDYGSGEIVYYYDYVDDEDEYTYFDNDKYSPILIIDSVVSVSTFDHYGSGSSIVIRKDGSLWAWGSNERGQLGDGTTERRYYPSRIIFNMGESDDPVDDNDTSQAPDLELPSVPSEQPGASPDHPDDTGSGRTPTTNERQPLAPLWLVIVCVILFVISAVSLTIHFVINRNAK